MSSRSMKLISMSICVNSELPVGAQVFVAETARNLEIPFHAADHQNLFELLRRLRQRVKLSRGHGGSAREIRARLPAWT